MTYRFGKVEITCAKDIVKYYESIHKSYNKTPTKPNLEHREWMTLISFLKKNMTKRCKMLHVTYPFTINKGERPDFMLVMKNRRVGIEIVRVVSKNLEAMISYCYKYHFNGWESDARLYNDDVKMTEKDFEQLVHRPGRDLDGDSMLGAHKERMWASMCYNAIRAKSQKNYAMDILLLDDQSVQSCYQENMLIGIEYLKRQLSETPFNVSNICTIISENQTGLIRLYDKPVWKFEYKLYKAYE